MIRGETIILVDRQENGKDEFNHPLYTETEVEIENVLIGNAASEEHSTETDLTGRKASFVLCIPKGDTHDWTDKKVKFWNRTFKTVGTVKEWVEDMIPLSWNKQVKVEVVNE